MDRIVARRGKLPAPFVPLLKTPIVADLFEQLSTELWASLPAAMLEAVFLMAAHRNRCAYQWRTHATKALAAGLTDRDIAVLGEGLPLTDGVLGDVTGFADELFRFNSVSQARFDATRARISERGVADLVMFCGFANAVSMLLNVRQPPVPPGDPLPF